MGYEAKVDYWFKAGTLLLLVLIQNVSFSIIADM